MRRRPARAALALALALAACSGEAPKTEPAPAPEAKAEPAKVEPAEAPKPEPAAPEAPPADPNEACGKIVVVAYKGATDADAAITRDKAAAEARARELHATITKTSGAAALDEVAAAESDDARTRAKRGAMGTFVRDQWPERFAALNEPIFALKIGEVSAPFEAPMGYVIAQRCPIEKVHTRHILLRYKGAKNADAKLKRSRAEALALAEALATEIAEGGDFQALAREKSEDGSAERGGDLGPVGRGMFAPAYEAAAFALAPGATSKVVETDFGFHIIQRVDGT